MKTTILISVISSTLAFGLFVGCTGGGIDLSGLNIQLPGQDITANWKSPANYARTPIGQNPVNPITLSADFSDHTGCPNKTYRFWLYSKDGGTPLAGIGSNAELPFDNHFEQVVSLPVGAPVYQIRLACTKANGDRYANSNILETGNPAFTPRLAISWQNPEGYTRTPSGTQPTNPITLSVNFSDEDGCPYQMYRFWSYSLNGAPVGPIGDIMTLTPGSGVTTTATLPANTPIRAVRLACVDSEGSLYASTANLEVGNPAFTPVATGTCTGQNTSLCTAPTESTTCSTCGGNWTTTPVSTTNICSGGSTVGGINACAAQTSQSNCENFGLLDGNGTQIFASSYCEWTGTACQLKETACTDLDTETRCRTLANGGYADCTWGPDPAGGSCFGNSTSLGEATCSALNAQYACEHQGVLDTFGNQALATSYCTWNGSECHIKSTVCTDLNNPTRCEMIASDGYGNCEWIPPSTCSNPTTSFCATPQTQTACTSCGGTWTSLQ